MPTTDKDKNIEYVKRSQAKKKEVLGVIEYNKINADNEQRHRDKLKTTLGTEEYNKERAEYMDVDYSEHIRMPTTRILNTHLGGDR